MKMDALYFPNLSLPSAAWTNPVALYFDQIGIIAPSEYEAGLSDRRTAALIDAGIAKPMFAGGFDHNDQDGEIVDGIARWWRDKERAKLPAQYRIHRGKLENAGLLQELIHRKLLKPDPSEADWLVGPEPVCLRVMTVLAHRIMGSERIGAVVTDDRVAFAMSASQPSVIASPSDRRLRTIASLLPVAPSATPEQVRRFKDDHRKELGRFRGFVEQLIRRNSDEDLFEARLADAEELRRHLVGELEAMNAASKSSGLFLMVSKLVASIFEGAFFTGSIDFGSGVSSRAAASRRGSEIAEDGLAYAVMAQSAFRPRSSRELLA